MSAALATLGRRSMPTSVSHGQSAAIFPTGHTDASLQVRSETATISSRPKAASEAPIVLVQFVANGASFFAHVDMQKSSNSIASPTNADHSRAIAMNSAGVQVYKALCSRIISVPCSPTCSTMPPSTFAHASTCYKNEAFCPTRNSSRSRT